MTNASSAFLIDTNVLVYAHDPRDRNKQQRALFVLDSLVRNEAGVLSAQCLSEFFSVVTRRLPKPMTADEALAQIERLARSFHVLNVTPQVVLEGCRGVAQHGMSIWDALIWAVAKLNQISYVLTEDAEHGRFLEGVNFLNPFAPAFDLGLIERDP